MENLRKIKQLSQRQAQKKFAMTELAIRKSIAKEDLRQSTLQPSQKIMIKNLDSNKVEVYSKQTLQSELLSDISRLPQQSTLFDSIFQHYLTAMEKEQELFLEACYQGDLAMVRKMLDGKNEHPINLKKAVTDEGKNGIHLATMSGSFCNADIIQALHQYGVNVDGKTNHECRTPLMLGCILGNQGAVTTLLKLNADHKAQDYEGNTALHLACVFQQKNIVKILLTCKVSTQVINKKGMKPMHCVPTNNQSLLEIITQYESIEFGDTTQGSEGFKRQQEKIKQVSVLGLGEGSNYNFMKLNQLGRGAFGQVFLVQNIKDGMKYAMKMLDKASIMRQNILRYTMQLLRYAMTQRQILSTLNHPFIVKLQYAFQTTHKLCLVMDYCPGGDLLRVIKQNGFIEQSLLRLYIAEVVLAIEGLHAAEIIYRDLKPSNVIIDKDGHACLTDFGLSKEAALAHSFCGSTAYLAPEMLWRRGHTKVLDWYLLGVLIYEGLTGRPPFWDSNKEQLIANIKRGQFKKLNSSFSAEVKDLIEKLLRANSSKRLGINGAEEVKKHAWFKDLNWGVVYGRGLKLPKREEIKGKPIKQEIFQYENGENCEKINGWDYSGV